MKRNMHDNIIRASAEAFGIREHGEAKKTAKPAERDSWHANQAGAMMRQPQMLSGTIWRHGVVSTASQWRSEHAYWQAEDMERR
jgi:hypothetical protein